MVLFWNCFLTCHQTTCTRESVCVAIGEVAECSQNNETRIVSTLSNISLNCTTVHIYVSSGTHILNGKLTFTDHVEETRIDGSPHGQKSVIECSNGSGVRFSESRNANKVTLLNLALAQCQYERDTRDRYSVFPQVNQVALYFKFASYSLQNVSVWNTEGYGVYSQESLRQEIVQCTFNNNTQGHIVISHTKINGYAGATEVLVKMRETQLFESKLGCAVDINTWNNATIIIRNSIFSNNFNGLHVKDFKKLELTDCLITNNLGNGTCIDMYTGADIGTSILVNVSNCLIENNTETGMIINQSSKDLLNPMYSDVSNVSFNNNSRALYLSFASWDETNDKRVTRISECTFSNSRLSPEHYLLHVVVVKSKLFIVKNISVVIEKCEFKGNQGPAGNYSALYIEEMSNVTLDNLDIHDNVCTGILLSSSTVRITNNLNISRSGNYGWMGGAIALVHAYDVVKPVFSQITLAESSFVNIVDNNAETYGGGIFSDETCEQRNTDNVCFFQFESDVKAPFLAFRFSGNTAKIGGDLVLGGCLSNCSIMIEKSLIPIDKTDPKNILWDIISIESLSSQSTLVEGPKKPFFCTNTSTLVPAIICNDSYSITAFRGQTFTIPLMAGDDQCLPTSKVLKVNGGSNISLFLEGQETGQLVIDGPKHCQNFPLAVAGALDKNTTSVEVIFHDPFSMNIEPAVLAIHLGSCPAGLLLNHSSERCKCHDGFRKHKIVCHSDLYTIDIPAQTWVGKYKEKLIVHKECLYCQNKLRTLSIDDITRLCPATRSGIMCGQCIEGHSLKLGGYECARCSKSSLVGVILVIAFASVGLILVVLLLRLDMTISTGAINGLILYSNIVYLNSDIFLPDRVGTNGILLNAVKILSTFQAWMNLDFGITACFFNGYSIYISTWMQFVFPLYIWLLIILIVLASWYSTTIARITTSNTVSVLATLLLLSYAKLLKTSIETFSSVQLTFLDGKPFHSVWKQDGNVPYLGRLHLPLFLMSFVMVMVYIIPFTLLILLGPLLRAKSHHWFLRWIHKIKPFLDAFYGPYTVRYRYWPGLLLLCRVLAIGIFVSYSTNDTPFILMAISMMVLALVILWLLIGKIHKVSFYQKQAFNYLELFSLSNLGIFSVASLYITQFTDSAKKLRNQQTLAVAMVGSILIVFCGIITYQMSLIALKFRAMREIKNSLQIKMKKLLRIEQEPHQLCETVGGTCSAAAVGVTYSTVDIKSSKLRESLLTEN